MKKQLRLWYCDFWKDFNIYSTEIFKILSEKYDVIFDEYEPYLLLFSRYGDNNKKYNCKKIRVSGENDGITNNADYYIGLSLKDDSYIYCYMPWIFNCGIGNLNGATAPIDKIVNREKYNKDRFCCFVVSNPYSKERIEVFDIISTYKHIDAGGYVRNNIDVVSRKPKEYRNFLQHYKFDITFENSYSEGYLTEKIFYALSNGCIPIYKGDSNVENIINPKCFINCNNLTHEEILDKVKEIDNNDELYNQMINEPVFNDPDIVNKYIDKLRNFLFNITDKLLANIYNTEYNDKLSYNDIYVKDSKIPVFCCNLIKDEYRLKNIKNEFIDKPEFSLNVLSFYISMNPKYGLFSNFIKAVKCANDNNLDYFIWCEDDHVFTEAYNKKLLMQHIQYGLDNNLDLILLGINNMINMETYKPINETYAELDHFCCTQFIIIYKQIYSQLLNFEFEKSWLRGNQYWQLNNNTLDGILSMFEHKVVALPFLSYQRNDEHSNISNNDTKNNERQFTSSEFNFVIHNDYIKSHIKPTKKYAIGLLLRTYNSEAFINECLESILKQTLLNKIKLVVVDDGSLDNTVNIIKEKFKDIPYKLIVHENNIGPVQGLIDMQSELDDCDYYMTMDSDDWYTSEDSIENLFIYAKYKDSDYICCDLPHVMRIYNAELFSKLPLEHFIVGEDRYPIWFEYYADKLHNTININYGFYHVRYREDSLSHGKNNAIFWRTEKALQLVFENIYYFNNICGKLISEYLGKFYIESYTVSDKFKEVNYDSLREKLKPLYKTIEQILENNKIYVIGNKPIDNNININNNGIIVMFNRLPNYDKVNKLDWWFVDIWWDFFNMYNYEYIKNAIKDIKRIFIPQRYKDSEEYDLFISKFGNEDKIEFINIDVFKNIDGTSNWETYNRFTTDFLYIEYLINNYHHISLTACDIYDRYKILSKQDSHKNTYHIGALKTEEKLLKQYIIDNKIDYIYKCNIHKPLQYGSSVSYDNMRQNKNYTLLPDNTYAEEKYSDTILENNVLIKNEIIFKFPSVSSFWHNESNVLPDLIVASIKSWIICGYKYYLYTYKNYDNIPAGVILKDANEILAESELFLDLRNSYALFSDYFRVLLINKEDTAWVDTDNFLLSDDFTTQSVFIIQDNRVQNSFFYIYNDNRGKLFKQCLLDFYNNPFDIKDYDNNEIKNMKQSLNKYNNKIDVFKNNWGIGGSTLYTNINDYVNMHDCCYEYNKYFNAFHYTEQYKLFVLPEKPYMKYYNRDVKILVMSYNLLLREPWIMDNYNDKSYIANILNDINIKYEENPDNRE